MDIIFILLTNFKGLNVEEDTAIDYFRYFLMKEIPFGNDGNYSRSSFLLRINSELANNVGNLAQRTLTMIFKNCDGELPAGTLDESLIRDVDINVPWCCKASICCNIQNLLCAGKVFT